MTKTSAIDAARVELLLTELRLPAIKQMWPKLAEQADKEGWPAARFLAALAELEIADRGRRRIERHLAEARLPVGKTLDAFDFAAVPMITRCGVRPRLQRRDRNGFAPFSLLSPARAGAPVECYPL